MRKPSFIAIIMAAALVISSNAQAALLVYEPFVYTAGATLNNVTPNGSTVGLNTTTAYSGSGANGYSVQASGLSFSGLQTSGGSVAFTGGTNVAAGQLSLATPPVMGTLYASYLVSLSARGAGTGDGVAVRVADNNTTGGDRFNIQADSRQTSTNVAINYGGSTSGVTNSGVSLNLNSTYLLIARFTNVGQVSVGTPGVATIYALDETQFGNFLLGGANDAYLDSASIGGPTGLTARISDDSITTGTFDFATDDFFALVSVNGSGRFDEVRYGTTLAAVTPIPEPGSVVIALSGLGLLTWRLARRKNT